MDSRAQYIAAVVFWTAALTDLAANRDQMAGRRFAELYPQTVQGDVDRSRNRRWHLLGFVQRLAVVAALAVQVQLTTGDWRQALAAAWVGACWTAAQFDADFNVRRMGWAKIFYLGESSLIDKLLGKFGAQHRFAAGAVSFIVKTLGAVLGVVFWAFYL
jgi:hypothetical protein